MPRSGGNADVRWFDVDPCYVFHPMNAYDDDGAVVLDVARYPQLLFMSPDTARDPEWRDRNSAKLHRWRIDLAKGGVTSTPLDDLGGEFPRVDERRVGLRHRFGYMAVNGPEPQERALPVFTAIRKYDLDRGTSETRAFGALNGCGEPLFAPRHGAAEEDDGYVLVLQYDHARDRSDFLVLDARHLNDEPLARIRIPHRVPYGFHGNWVPADA
jgi:carotenoid cleavage dioxygenase